VLTDQSLSEAVILLQRQELAPETREIVEEAARLLAEGREGEARALIEKAEALAAIEQNGERIADPSSGKARSDRNAARGLQAIVAPLAAKLAEGFTGVLTSILEEVQKHAGDQVQVVAQALQEHIDDLDAAICDVVSVTERLQQRATEQEATLDGVQHGQQQLWDAVRGLHEADQRQSEAVHHVTRASEELSRHLANQVDAAASRFAALEERVNGLDRFAEELPAQLSGIMSRLDGHTEALRFLEQRQSQRVSRLNQVLESLAALREPEAPELAMPAVA